MIFHLSWNEYALLYSIHLVNYFRILNKKKVEGASTSEVLSLVRKYQVPGLDIRKIRVTNGIISSDSLLRAQMFHFYNFTVFKDWKQRLSSIFCY